MSHARLICSRLEKLMSRLACSHPLAAFVVIFAGLPLFVLLAIALVMTVAAFPFSWILTLL